MIATQMTPFRLSFKIWITALLLNTFLGSGFLLIREGNFNPKYYFELPAIGLMWGAIFSLPIFIIMIFLILRMVIFDIKWQNILNTILIIDIVLISVAFFAFYSLFQLSVFDNEFILPLPFIIIISVISSVFLFRKDFQNLYP